jgi:hypothetical protein
LFRFKDANTRSLFDEEEDRTEEVNRCIWIKRFKNGAKSKNINVGFIAARLASTTNANGKDSLKSTKVNR